MVIIQVSRVTVLHVIYLHGAVLAPEPDNKRCDGGGKETN